MQSLLRVIHIVFGPVLEGIWLQDVFEGQEGNSVAVFSVDYERDGDTYSVLGHAYSAELVAAYRKSRGDVAA